MQNDAEWSNFEEMLYNVESFDVSSKKIILWLLIHMVYRYESCFYGGMFEKKTWARFKTFQEIG